MTGGASGIGRALATALADRSGHVVVADADAGAARAVAEQVDATTPGSAVAAVLDVTDAAAVTDLVHTVHDEHGRLDVLCNNAGIGLAVPAADLRLADWERTLDVNLQGVVHGCAAAVPLMVAAGRGRICNTASLAGLVGGLGPGAPYAASKFGVVGLSSALHAGLAPRGVGVHALCPGPVDTPLLDRRDLDGLTVPTGVPVRTARDLLGMLPVPLADPDRVARDALRGMARDRPLIVTPASARVAWWAYRLAPGAVLALARRGERWLARR